MLSLPWGIILLLPLSCLLFGNRGRRLSRAVGQNRRGLLWFIFFLLAGSFITLSTGRLYLNLGGLLSLGGGLYLLRQAKARERWRMLAAALLAGCYGYVFALGRFWWLAKLSWPTDWLLPLVAALLAFAAGGGLRAALAGLAWGLTVALALAGYQLSGGLLLELGSFATLNTLLVALFAAGGLDLLFHRPRPEVSRLQVKKQSL